MLIVFPLSPDVERQIHYIATGRPESLNDLRKCSRECNSSMPCSNNCDLDFSTYVLTRQKVVATGKELSAKQIHKTSRCISRLLLWTYTHNNQRLTFEEVSISIEPQIPL